MANAVKWEAIWTSRSTVLTTELNSLANGAYSAAGTEIDNSSNLDQYGKVEINLASLSPTAGACLELYMITAPDGTNYEDAPGTNNPATHILVACIPVDTTATDAKLCMSPVFFLQPAKTKFVLKNATGVALASSGNTVELFTSNDEIQ
jgi:hypothetical protein